MERRAPGAGTKKGALAGALIRNRVSERRNQRLENWKLRRAFRRPYFLRSTTRLSRVRKP